MKVVRAINGNEAIVSDQDHDLVSQFRWSTVRKQASTGGFYFVVRKRGTTTYMHRLIMGAGAGQEVDHINGNPADNRRENLRLATKGQNNANRRYSPKSGFRGVYAQPWGRTWQVKIIVDGKVIRGGNFKDPTEAARKYDELAREHFGEFATLNFATGEIK